MKYLLNNTGHSVFSLINMQFVISVSDSVVLQVNSPQLVFIAVNSNLELNCTIRRHINNLHPTHLLWKHKNTWRPNNSYVVDNYTVQLKIPHTSYKDAGVYGCGVYHNSSQFQSITSQNVTVVVGGMQYVNLHCSI